MGKPKIDRAEWWFRPEPCRDTGEALTAMALEARRRGITYGQLAANTTPYEQQEIIRDYCKEKARNRRRQGSGRSG